MSLPWGMKIHPVVAMAQVNLPGPLFLNLALEPSHLRYSARVLKTSHVPTHNTCATKHSGLSHSLRVIRIASCAFTFLDAALPVGRTPSQRLCVLLRICSDHSGATRTGHSLAHHRRHSCSCLWWKVAALICGASPGFLLDPGLGGLVFRSMDVFGSSARLS